MNMNKWLTMNKKNHKLWKFDHNIFSRESTGFLLEETCKFSIDLNCTGFECSRNCNTYNSVLCRAVRSLSCWSYDLVTIVHADVCPMALVLGWTVDTEPALSVWFASLPLPLPLPFSSSSSSLPWSKFDKWDWLLRRVLLLVLVPQRLVGGPPVRLATLRLPPVGLRGGDGDGDEPVKEYLNKKHKRIDKTNSIHCTHRNELIENSLIPSFLPSFDMSEYDEVCSSSLDGACRCRNLLHSIRLLNLDWIFLAQVKQTVECGVYDASNDCIICTNSVLCKRLSGTFGSLQYAHLPLPRIVYKEYFRATNTHKHIWYINNWLTEAQLRYSEYNSFTNSFIDKELSVENCVFRTFSLFLCLNENMIRLTVLSFQPLNKNPFNL